MCETKTEHTRTAKLIGESGIEKLNKSRVAVIGLGGVGGACAEALARAGIGRLLIIDKDIVEKSNLNRQIVSEKNVIGMRKVDAMRLRLNAVSDCIVDSAHVFIGTHNVSRALSGRIDYIIDAVDNVTAKLELIKYAKAHEIGIISCMGAGNRLDPTALYITDIYKTERCPLARAVRKGCREIGVKSLPVVMSNEPPIPHQGGENSRVPGSSPFVPPAAGLAMAYYAIKSLCEK